MIRVTFRDSDSVWVLEPDDEITVGGQTFQASDLKTIELIDLSFRVSRGFAQTPEGSVEAIGFRWKDGGEDVAGTGIEVLWPVPPDKLPEIIDGLVAKQVVVARSMPGEVPG